MTTDKWTRIDYTSADALGGPGFETGEIFEDLRDAGDPNVLVCDNEVFVRGDLARTLAGRIYDVQPKWKVGRQKFYPLTGEIEDSVLETTLYTARNEREEKVRTTKLEIVDYLSSLI